MTRKWSFIPLLMIALLVLFPGYSVTGAQKGIDIWTKNIVPTLFPFAVASTLFINSGVMSGLKKPAKKLRRWILIPPDAINAVATGLISGYPVGAGMTSLLFKQNKICKDSVAYITALSSFCSPVFMLATVGIKFANEALLGILITVAHYISFAVTALILKKHSEQDCNFDSYTEDAKKVPFGETLKISIENGIKTVLTVGGYIVLFSIILEFVELCNFLPQSELLKCIISSLLELSNGCAAITVSSLPIAAKTSLLSFATTFGGLCVLLQINGFLSESGTSIRELVKFKLVQALFSAAIGYIMSFMLL